MMIQKFTERKIAEKFGKGKILEYHVRNLIYIYIYKVDRKNILKKLQVERFSFIIRIFKSRGTTIFKTIKLINVWHWYLLIWSVLMKRVIRVVCTQNILNSIVSKLLMRTGTCCINPLSAYFTKWSNTLK